MAIDGCSRETCCRNFLPAPRIAVYVEMLLAQIYIFSLAAGSGFVAS